MLTGNTDRVAPNGTKLYFRGLKILEASLHKLGDLGLKGATSVLLTGVVHGGTAVFIHADRVGAMLKDIAPGLKVYKALPADGIREWRPPLPLICEITAGDPRKASPSCYLPALSTLTLR